VIDGGLCLFAFIVSLLVTVGVMLWLDRRRGPRCIVCGKHDTTGQGHIKCDYCGKYFCRTDMDQLSVADRTQELKPAEERTGHGAAINLYGRMKNLCNYCLDRI
jgi:hypothetical protein